MKALLAVVLFVVSNAALAQSVELHVMFNGSRQHVNDKEVVAALTEMVESSSVDTTEYVHPTEQWGEALAAPIFIHALFDRPRRMKVWQEGDTVEPSHSAVREIVIVLPGAPHILLKTDAGVRSVAKYSACALEKVLTAAKLNKITNVEIPAGCS